MDAQGVRRRAAEVALLQCVEVPPQDLEGSGVRRTLGDSGIPGYSGFKGISSGSCMGFGTFCMLLFSLLETLLRPPRCCRR